MVTVKCEQATIVPGWAGRNFKAGTGPSPSTASWRKLRNIRTDSLSKHAISHATWHWFETKRHILPGPLTWIVSAAFCCAEGRTLASTDMLASWVLTMYPSTC